jgi:hypothetical protein
LLVIKLANKKTVGFPQDVEACVFLVTVPLVSTKKMVYIIILHFSWLAEVDCLLNSFSDCHSQSVQEKATIIPSLMTTTDIHTYLKPPVCSAFVACSEYNRIIGALFSILKFYRISSYAGYWTKHLHGT